MTARSAASVLADRARRTPEEPWLFYRPELDFEWRSWRQVAVQVAGGPVLSAGALPELGTAIAYPSFAHPDSLALDLALTAAGYFPAPLAPRPWPPAEEVLEELAAPSPPKLAISPAPGPFAAAPPATDLSSLASSEAEKSSGCVVRVDGKLCRLSSQELCTASLDALQPLSLARQALARPQGRDVIVIGGPLIEARERLLFTWGALEAAALILEPSDEARAETVIWVRPTLLHGSAAELEELFSLSPPKLRGKFWVARAKPRLAPPFDRVRGIVVFGPDALPPRLEAPWLEAGISLLHVARPLCRGAAQNV